MKSKTRKAAGKSSLDPLVRCNKVQDRCAGCQHAIPHKRTERSCAGWCYIGLAMRCRTVTPNASGEGREIKRMLAS